MYRVRKINDYIFGLEESADGFAWVLLFKSSELECYRAQRNYESREREESFTWEGVSVYRVKDTEFWYTLNRDISGAQFDIRTIASILISGSEFFNSKIVDQVVMMSASEIFIQAYNSNLIRVVGHYVVPIGCTIDIGNYGGRKR